MKGEFGAYAIGEDVRKFLIDLTYETQVMEDREYLFELSKGFSDRCAIVEARSEEYGVFEKAAILALLMGLKWRLTAARRKIRSVGVSEALEGKVQSMEEEYIEPFLRAIVHISGSDIQPFDRTGLKESLLARLETLRTMAPEADERRLRRLMAQCATEFDELEKTEYARYGAMTIFSLALEMRLRIGGMVSEDGNYLFNREVSEVADLIETRYLLPALMYTARSLGSQISRHEVENFACLW